MTISLRMALAAVALIGFAAVTRDAVSLALLIYLGVATMALAYGLLYAGLRTTSGSAATVGTLVERCPQRGESSPRLTGGVTTNDGPEGPSWCRDVQPAQ